MARPEEYTPQQIIDALRKCEGFQSMAAEMLGCVAETIMRYRREYPEVERAYLHIKGKHLDFAEGKLLNNIKEGKETSLIFYLKTQGKNRGYVEKQEIEHSGMVSIDTVLDAMSDEQRRNFIRRLTEQSESK